MSNKKAYDSFNRKRIIYEHEIILPTPPPIEEIQNFGLPIREQKFKPIEFPKNWDDLTLDQQNEFKKEEKRKIKNGFWFFNGGNLEYITGVHYFYISWWKIKVSPEGKPKRMGLPSFIDADRDFFYVWDHAVKNPKRAGVAFITNRRDGKTYKAGVIAYLSAISNPDGHVGMQSKTESDAKKIMKKIIDSWKQLPFIFKPPDTGETSPTNSLRFQPRSTSDSKTSIKDRRNDEEYPNSWIDYESSDSYAYDGEDLIFYLLDEFGKPQKSDTNETLGVVLETLVDGSYITGKTLCITTVEDIESKGEDEGVKGIWNGADIHKLNDFGMTKNGLIQYFKPAYYGYRGVDENNIPFINEFGYTDWRRAKAYFEKKREFLEGIALTRYIRKYPFSIEEAFQTTTGCYFSEKKINEHLDFNKIYVNKDNLQRGNFYFKTDITNPEVFWNPHPEGKFLVSWFPDVKDRNKWQWTFTEVGRQRSPLGLDIRGGVDPFDHRKTVDGRSSDAGFHLFRKSSVWDGDEENKDPLTNTFILEYIYRADTPEEMYEDVLAACVFFGARLLAENNKSGLVNFFRIHGYFDYLIKRPESTHSNYSKSKTIERGIALSGDVPRRNLPNRLMSHIYNDLGKNDKGEMKVFMPFNRTLQDWKIFNPNKWTDYDATVSSMLALVASDVEIKIKSQEPEYSKPIIPIWDNSGETPILLN